MTKNENDTYFLFDLKYNKNLIFIEKYLISEMKYHELRKLYQEINNDIISYKRVSQICPHSILSHNEALIKKYSFLDKNNIINGLEEIKNNVYKNKNLLCHSLIDLYNQHFNTEHTNITHHEKNIIKYVNLCKDKNITFNEINYDDIEYLRNINSFINCYID